VQAVQELLLLPLLEQMATLHRFLLSLLMAEVEVVH
jgi:hypothetical protein